MTTEQPTTRGDREWSELQVAPDHFASTVLSRTFTGRHEGQLVERDAGGGRFAGLFASGHDDGSVLLRAAIARYGELEVVSTKVPSSSSERPASYQALTPYLPGAAWYEREIADLFGLVPEGLSHVDPLVLPRKDGEPPPRPGATAGDRPAHIVPDDSAPAAHLTGEGVFTLPYGPVRSGIFEAVQFLVETPGEDIPYLCPRVYYKHRGAETRFEGMPPADGALLAERVEGVASVAHAMAFCQAIESLDAHEAAAPPEGALLVRAVHAELERIANHLDSTARHTEAAGQAVAYARLTWHKERVMRLRADLCGHRFGRGVVIPGGVSGPPAIAPAAAIGALAAIEGDVRSDMHLLMATSSFVDRIRGTGVLPGDVARSKGALGPVGRASGLEEDIRSYRPYGPYRLIAVPGPRARGSGDALARQLVRLEEMWSSFELSRRALEDLGHVTPEGPWAVPVGPADGTGWGWVEAPQGELLYLVEVEGNRLRRVKPRSASFHNLSIFPDAFTGDIFTDFAFIEASFGLSIAGVAG